MTIGFLITYLTGQEIYYFRLDFLGIGILKGVSLARVAEILIYGKYILFYAYIDKNMYNLFILKVMAIGLSLPFSLYNMQQ